MSKAFLQYHNFRLPCCLCIEFLLISNAVILSVALRLSPGSITANSGLPYILHAVLIAFVCQVCMYYTDLYELRVALNTNALLIKVAQSLGMATAVLLVIFYILPQLFIGRGVLALSLAFAFGALVGWRLFYQRLYALSHFKINVLIIGTSEEARKLAMELQTKQPLGYEMRGFIGESHEVGKDLL